MFERVFKEFGLPNAIRTDNGVPFSSSQALFGLNKLSVWWLRLGISIERIKPGNLQENGCHERMHLTLKKETTKPAGENFLQQQEKFDTFIHEYNHERPHQALQMRYPGEIYMPSTKEYKGLGIFRRHRLHIIPTGYGSPDKTRTCDLMINSRSLSH